MIIRIRKLFQIKNSVPLEEKQNRTSAFIVFHVLQSSEYFRILRCLSTQKSTGTLSLIPKPVLLCLLVFTMHNLNGELSQIAFYLKIKCTFCRLEVLLIGLF